MWDTTESAVKDQDEHFSMGKREEDSGTNYWSKQDRYISLDYKFTAWKNTDS